MKKHLVITNNENYYLIEAISSMSAAKKLISYLLKKNNVTLDEVFDLIKNVKNIMDLTKFNLENIFQSSKNFQKKISKNFVD
nr:MAG: hypothetical protein [Bacteriophage sp.]